MIRFRYHHSTVGGTFDRLHSGHEALLTKAFTESSFVTIAVTSDEYPHVKNFGRSKLPYTRRVADLNRFLSEHSWMQRSKIIPLMEFQGPSVTDASMDCIIVTKETRHHAVLINTQRLKNGLTKLAIITVPFIKSTDRKIIRSSRIRAGEIDRSGQLYIRLFRNHSKSMPSHMRTVLRKPLGTVIPGTDTTIHQTAQRAVTFIKQHNPPLVITIGDIITSSLKEAGYPAHLSIIDYRNNRKKLLGEPVVKTLKKYNNPAGTIMAKPVEALYQLMQSKLIGRGQTVVIQGEEDLLALPSILMAPLESFVLYGQFNKGIVIVRVTEEIKYKVEAMLKEFV